MRVLRALLHLALAAGLGIAAVAAVPFLLVGVMVGQAGWEHWRQCRGYTRFDAAAWRDEALARGPRAVRGCMVDDLLAAGRLVGRPRAAVVALLGEPRPTGYFRDYDLVYWLGPERGLFSIDSEWLVLRLDRAGRVREAKLVTD
jgi:hypothetical protein